MCVFAIFVETIYKILTIPFCLLFQNKAPYLNGFLDLPQGFWESLTGRQEPENALTVPW